MTVVAPEESKYYSFIGLKQIFFEKNPQKWRQFERIFVVVDIKYLAVTAPSGEVTCYIITGHC